MFRRFASEQERKKNGSSYSNIKENAQNYYHGWEKVKKKILTLFTCKLLKFVWKYCIE